MNWPAASFDWNQARAFLATAEHGSLSAAARALQNVLRDLGFAIEVEVSQINTDPWDFVLTP